MAVGFDAACANISACAPWLATVAIPKASVGLGLGVGHGQGLAARARSQHTSTGAVRTGAGGRERQHPTDMLVCHTPSAPCARLPGGCRMRVFVLQLRAPRLGAPRMRMGGRWSARPCQRGCLRRADGPCA